MVNNVEIIIITKRVYIFLFNSVLTKLLKILPRNRKHSTDSHFKAKKKKNTPNPPKHL